MLTIADNKMNDYKTKLSHILNNSARYIQHFLWIKDKRGDIIPFNFNRVQVIYRRMKRILLAQKRETNPYIKPHYMVLKYRQGGITTEEQGENFHLTATQENQNVITLAHNWETTQEIFDIAQLFDRLLPARASVKPIRDWENKREIEYKRLNSKFHIGTAGNTSFGRGQTFQRVHCSEVPLFGKKKNQHSLSINDIENLISGLCIACPYGEVVLEGTGQGAAGWFYNTWQESKEGGNDWIRIFLPWYIDPLNSLSLMTGERLDYTDEEKDLIRMVKDNYNIIITAEQIKWRRITKNRVRKLFPQEYPEDDITCFLLSGNSRFDVSILRKLINQCKKPVETKDNGQLVIWEKPVTGRRYVIGADVGEGMTNSDYSAGVVLDVVSCEQVARLMGRWKPETFAIKLANLGLKYNTALLGVEANNHGHSTLNTLLNTLHYPRLYYHTDYDSTGSEKLGWQTNGKTRNTMISDLATAIDEYLMKINDPLFINQCMTFQKDGDGKYQAGEGCYDDLVIAWAISYQLKNVKIFVPTITT